jgi:hypothetical protein
MRAHRVVWTALAMLSVAATTAAAQAATGDTRAPAALLASMVGTWRVETVPASGEPRLVVGSRTFSPGIDDLTLRWDEVHRGGAYSEGYLGYDAASERFYLLAVQSDEAARVTILSGTPSEDGSTIHWTPVRIDSAPGAASEEMIDSIMTLTQRSILWIARDDRWAFEFVRQ